MSKKNVTYQATLTLVVVAPEGCGEAILDELRMCVDEEFVGRPLVEDEKMGQPTAVVVAAECAALEVLSKSVRPQYAEAYDACVEDCKQSLAAGLAAMNAAGDEDER